MASYRVHLVSAIRKGKNYQLSLKNVLSVVKKNAQISNIILSRSSHIKENIICGFTYIKVKTAELNYSVKN